MKEDRKNDKKNTKYKNRNLKNRNFIGEEKDCKLTGIVAHSFKNIRAGK